MVIKRPICIASLLKKEYLIIEGGSFVSFYMIGLLLCYMILNVYTDLKYRKTKNVWHALFLSIGLVVTYMVNARTMKDMVSVMIVALICGLIMEMFKFSSPGDTKMLAVVALYVGNLVEDSAIVTAITLTAFHLLFIWFISVYRLIKIMGVKGAIKNQFEHAASLFGIKVPEQQIQLIKSFPGACSILLGAVMYIGVTYYQTGGFNA